MEQNSNDQLQGDRLTSYKVSFFKNLLGSDGHPFKCLQQAIEVHHARNAERAIQAAEHRYERLHWVPNWKLHADAIELETLPRDQMWAVWRDLNASNLFGVQVMHLAPSDLPLRGSRRSSVLPGALRVEN